MRGSCHLPLALSCLFAVLYAEDVVRLKNYKQEPVDMYELRDDGEPWYPGGQACTCAQCRWRTLLLSRQPSRACASCVALHSAGNTAHLLCASLSFK